MDVCRTEVPALLPVDGRHASACHLSLADEGAHLPGGGRGPPMSVEVDPRIEPRRTRRRSSRCSSSRASRSTSRSRAGSSSRSKVGQVHAVDGIDLEVLPGRDARPGGRDRLREVDAGAAHHEAVRRDRGQIWFEGEDITALKRRASCEPLRREMQMIFQDPYASLNPRKTIGSIIGDAVPHPRDGRRRTRSRSEVQQLMELVGPEPRALQPLPARVLRRPAAADRRRPRARAAARS